MELHNARLVTAVEDAWTAAMRLADAEADFPDPHITSDRIGSMLLDLVHSKVSELSVALNLQRVSIFRLPAELIIDMFEELAVPERFKATQVCKLWRDIILAAPRIWTKIVYGRRLTPDTSFMSSHSALKRLLNLSDPCPIRVDIEISHPDSGWKDVFSMLRHNMYRISALQLSVYSDDLTVDDLEGLGDLLRVPAPVLRTFLLEDCRTTVSPSLDTPFHLFDKYAPVLQDVILQMDISLLSDSADTLRTAQRVLFNHTSRTGARHLALMLQLVPHATDIMICLQDWDDSEVIPLDALSLPASLQMLNMYANGGIDVAAKAMRCLQWQNVQRFELFRKGPDLSALPGLLTLVGRSPEDDLNGGTPASSPEFIVRTAAIDWYIEPDTVSPERGPIIHMYDVDAEMHRLVPLESPEKVDLPVQRERIFFEIAEPLPEWLFAHLTRLYLSELVLDPEVLRDQIPPLPNLIHLTVWIMPSKYHRAGVGTSLFIETHSLSPDEPHRKIICPALRTLDIAASKSEWTPSIRPSLATETIRDFIVHRLRYDEAKLACLTIVGVEPYVTDASSLDLLQFAHAVVCEERFMGWGPNQRPANAAAWS